MHKQHKSTALEAQRPGWVLHWSMPITDVQYFSVKLVSKPDHAAVILVDTMIFVYKMPGWGK